MRKPTLSWLAIAALVAIGSEGIARAQSGPDPYQIVNRYPHDANAFTQGLVYENGTLYESTGLYGSSTLREVNLTTGAVIRKVDVPSQYFAEGMTLFQGKIFQLTWQSHVGFIYDPATLVQIGQFSYAGEGWGLTHDSQYLILSDGTNQIRFLHPTTFQTVRTISVFDYQGNPLTNINELEYINGEIFANVWQSNAIIRIDPATGSIRGWLDLTGLLPAGTQADVLNGIAYDSATHHLLVTGKLWPYLFELDLAPNSSQPINLALASNGAVARASSSYGANFDPSGAIDGDRRGVNWGSGGGWADGTPGVFPDWLEVDFPGTTTLSQVNVFTVQDAFWAPVAPTSSMTFTNYGITAFDIEYWNGSAWTLVPGGRITGNALVWRTVSFSPISTSRIRVLINSAADSYSRVTEIEAYGTATTPPPSSTNVALASSGAVARASSSYSSGFAPSGSIDGDRKGLNWGTSGGWADGTPGAFPDWLEVEFSTAFAITQINVFTVQDAFYAPPEPTSSTTFTQYGLTDFDVQYWTGSAWVTVPGGSVTGNTLVWRGFSFAAITTTKIRVLANRGADSFSRIVEVEAYTGDATPPPTITNVALSSNGAIAQASSAYSSGFAASGAIDGDRAGRNWGSNGGWADGTSNTYPDWLEVDFTNAFTINQINVFTVQDAFSTPSEPTSTMTFSQYGIRNFEAQYWNGSSWVAIPGGTVTANSLVWRSIAFPSITTSRIRILVTSALNLYSRITEVEALTAP